MSDLDTKKKEIIDDSVRPSKEIIDSRKTENRESEENESSEENEEDQLETVEMKESSSSSSSSNDEKTETYKEDGKKDLIINYSDGQKEKNQKKPNNGMLDCLVKGNTGRTPKQSNGYTTCNIL